MKLLLDANISWRLVNRLESYCEACLHVDFTSLDKPATDLSIWEYAMSNGYIIVTNDDDFLNLLNIKGFPPKVVLLRTGNQSTKYLETILVQHLTDIEDLAVSTEFGLLEIF